MGGRKYDGMLLSSARSAPTFYAPQGIVITGSAQELEPDHPQTFHNPVRRVVPPSGAHGTQSEAAVSSRAGESACRKRAKNRQKVLADAYAVSVTMISLLVQCVDLTSSAASGVNLWRWSKFNVCCNLSGSPDRPVLHQV